MIEKVCVFCGSALGADPAFRQAAADIAVLLAKRKIGIVYGGANRGLMKVLADAALAQGGEVIGVMPQFLVDQEVVHNGLSHLHIVASMHERKALMEDLSGAFIALPGGMGTIEELCEILTWRQLGLHQKPCGLLNTAGYYDDLLAMFDKAANSSFMKQEHRQSLLSASTPEDLLSALLKT